MRLLIWLLIGFVIYQIFRKRKGNDIAADVRPKVAETHKDPVCGVYVSDDDAVVGNLEGERIYFCSHECLDRFREQLTHTQ